MSIQRDILVTAGYVFDSAVLTFSPEEYRVNFSTMAPSNTYVRNLYISIVRNMRQIIMYV